MSTSKAGLMPNSSTIERCQSDRFLHWKLRWRQNYLVVTLKPSASKTYLPALDTQGWLVDCLKVSQVKGVYIDAALGEVDVKFWVDACAQANKTAFLRLPPQLKRARRQNLLSWKLQESIEQAIALLLILLLSPTILGLYCVSLWRSSEPISCQQWYVDKQGKVFKLDKFQMLRKFKLDRLPELFNLLQGEIGIIRRQHLTLEQVVRLSVLNEQPRAEKIHEDLEFERNAEKLHRAEFKKKGIVFLD